MNAVTASRPAETFALETAGLCKSFGALPVARNIDLRIEHGARHAIIGPNGAGKTTLVNLISGKLKPSAGDVFVFGERVTALAEDARVHRGVVRTFQINKLFQSLAVIDNLAMAIGERDRLAWRVFRQTRTDAERFDEALEILATLDMAASAYGAVKALPYGQQRLVEVGIALALRPKVLILDEPAAGVSSSESHLITDAIAALPNDISVLIIEHNMDVVFRFASHITVLDAGAVLASGPPREIAINREVKERYLGRAVHV